jgi:amidase/aspartyl-tRNA(Asn)/glutamyl-tRNA(Gln) amidotransferase subunit A
MNFRAWQELSPEKAARELHARIRSRLPAAQIRAAIASLPPEAELAAALAAAPRERPLQGVPFFAKDLFDVAGLPTLAGSTFLPEVRPTPTRDAHAVEVLGKAGAVLAGKTHLHEFAYGVTGENPHYGDCEHPRFPGRTTGGSSSGSAAVVAAGIAPLALGTDTGGSVRLPAAFCGLFGFRLTPRDVWVRDVFPLSPTFDTSGWFTSNAEDMRLALSALTGLRQSDRAPVGCYLELPGIDADVAAACRVAAAVLTAPAEPAVRDELLEGFSRAVTAYHAIVSRESWAVHQSWANRYRDRYDPVVWERVNRVHNITVAELEQADRELIAVRARWAQFFQTYDFLVLPGSPCAALTKAECTLENRSRILSLMAPASLGGFPVLTIPVALGSGLSTGLQIVVKETSSPVIDWALQRFL